MAEAGQRQRSKRNRITEAAVEVFARKGFHNSRVSDIARGAGVADGTIYLYFRNKEDLLLSIFEEKMDDLLEGMKEALAGAATIEGKIRAYAHYHFHMVGTNPSVAEVLQVELRLSNKFLKEYRPEKLWIYLQLFANLIREGQATGQFRQEVDPFIHMWAFFGALDELAMQWVLSSKRDAHFHLEKAAAQVADTFIRGLRREGAVAEISEEQ